MRALKRNGTSLGLLLVMALSLVGCVHVDRGVTLNSDGSGSYALTIGFIDALITSSTDSTSTMMNQFGAQVKQAGGSYREYEDNGYTYWAYTRPFSNITTLNTYLGQLPQSAGGLSSSVGSASASSTSDSITFTEQQGALSNTFHVKGHLSLAIPSGGGTGGVDLTPYLKDMRDSFAVTMPGTVTAHTGGSINGNTVTYLIHGGDQTDIDVTGSALNTGGYAAIGGGAALVLILVGLGMFFWLRRRRTSAPQLAAQVAYGAPAAPSAPFTPTWPGGAPQSFTQAPSYPPQTPSSYPPQAAGSYPPDPAQAPKSTPGYDAPLAAQPSLPPQSPQPGTLDPAQ
jgi:hypothetical protein